MSASRTSIAYILSCAAFALLLTTPRSGEAKERDRLMSARDLATLTDLDGLAISPDGRWAAFQTRQGNPDTNTHTQAWYLTSTGGGAPRRVADGGNPIQTARLGRVNGRIQTPPPAWSSDSQWITYLRKDKGRTQVWRTHIDGRSEQLTRNEGDVTALSYSADGLHLFFETELSRAQTAARLAEESHSGFLFDERFVPTYSPLPLMPAFSSSEVAPATVGLHDLWVYEFASHRERRATPVESAAYDELVRGVASRAAISAGGARAYVEALGHSGERRVAAQFARSDKPVICEAEECNSRGLRGLWWRNADELIFARYDNQNTALYAWRVGDAVPRLLLTTPDLLVPRGFYWTCSIGGGRLICFRERSNYPRELVAVDLSTGTIESLYDPNPHFARLNLGATPRYIEITTETGVQTDGYVVLPPNHRSGDRLPLVIVTYRCSGFLRGGTGDEYPAFPFAAQGFAVLCYDIPTEDDERRRELGERYEAWARGPGDPIKHRIQQGLDTVVRQLVATGLIDPDRVGVTGLSYGAETVTFALFTMRHLSAGIASGTEIGPASSFLYGPVSRGRNLRAWGLDSWSSDRWDTLSITRNADLVRAPLLLNVADHEMVDALHAVVALQQAGRAVEMYVFPDSYHIKHQPAHRLAIYDRNIDWMNFWLRRVEDPSPAKSAQYERWRAMRVKQCELFKGEYAPWYCRP